MAVRRITTLLAVAAITIGSSVGGTAWAHCDAESGPVAVDAREALETGEFARVAIWVTEEQTEELHDAFDRSLPVYQMGGEAQGLAAQHFMETAVRLHREAEGFPYSGLQPPQPLPPDVAAAERALETGDLQPVSDLLAGALQGKLETIFRRVRGAQTSKERSLADGREWADAYVEYVTFVHGLYDTIEAGPAHGVGDAD